MRTAKRRIRKCRLVAATILLLSFSAIKSRAADIVYDPTNHTENLAIALSTAKSVISEAEQVKQGITNLLKYEGSFVDVAPLIARLQEVLKRGQGLSYSMGNIDQVFKDSFTGYSPTEDWQTEYKAWSEITLDTFKNTLNSLNLQAKDIASDDALIKNLEGLSNSAEGRDQLLQTSNMLASEMNKQMIKLRKLIMAQVNSENVYRAKLENEKAHSEASLAEFFGGNRSREVLSYDSIANKTGHRPSNPAER